MPAIENVLVPDLGGASEVVVIEVLVKPGDAVKAEAAIVTLESDKATMDVPVGFAGIIKEVKVKIGDKVTTGAVLLTIESAESVNKPLGTTSPQTTSDQPVAAAVQAKKTEAVEPQPPKQTLSAIAPQAPTPVGSVSAEDVHAGPAVRRLAREFGVDLTRVQGTGFKERVLKEDVQAYVKSKLAQSAASGSGLVGLLPLPVTDFTKFGEIDIQALSRVKKISGKNLHRNWVMIPHVTQFGEADITDLETYRQQNKPRFEKEGVKLTPLVFIMKAIVECLKKFPTFNASLDSSGENLILKKYFHLGVAVDTVDGLVVPVIRDVDHKQILSLAQELAVVSEKARHKQLLPNDMQGGCFSISSLGGIGGTAFTPIINAPEVAILGVSKVMQKPVYQNATWVPRMLLPLSLSYDHRVIDGAEAARFMVYLSELLSDIRHLLL